MLEFSINVSHVLTKVCTDSAPAYGD